MPVRPQPPAGNKMADRSWFFAPQGQQQGPFRRPSSAVHRRGQGHRGNAGLDRGHGELATGRGYSRPVGGSPGPPAMPRPGGLARRAASGRRRRLSIDLDLWDFVWRSLTLVHRALLSSSRRHGSIVMYCKWIVSCVQVPGRPQLRLHRPARDADVVFRGFDLHHRAWPASMRASLNHRLVAIVQLVLYWLLIRWFVAQHQFERQPLGLRFSGSFWGYLGWNLLAFVSAITIIGWAWVYTAQIRWMCRNIEGTRREVVFNATGLEFLWRSRGHLDRLRLRHPDSLGDALVHRLAGFATRIGRAIG